MYIKLLSSLFLTINSFGQCPTLPNDQLVLSTQQEVEDFIQNYPNCTIIDGDFLINKNVTDVSGLNFITSVSDRFSIYGSSVTEINGFNNLSFVGGYFTLSNNDELVSINGFNSLLTINHFAIQNNTILQNIDGFNILETVTDDMWFSGNIELVSVSGFDQLTEAHGTISFDSNHSLLIIPDFNNLIRIHKQLQFVRNGLIEISGFNNLESVGLYAPPEIKSPGGLNIQFMPSLKRITGFNSLIEIGKQLLVRYNDVINDISGISNLERIGLFFDLSDNPMLASLEGLNSLTEVSNGSLTGSPNAFTLTNNPLLTDCTLICPLLISKGVNGTVVISNNLMGCNSEEQVINSCLDEEYTVPNFFTPNNDNSNDTWTIRGQVNQDYAISIYNRFGKLIKRMNPFEEWDGTYNGVQLPSSDYWYKIAFEDGTIKKGHFSLIRK